MPEPTEPQPPVRELLLKDLDELFAAVTRALDGIEAVTSQLTPERARACKGALALTRLGVIEIHDRAHARPLDEGDNR